MKSKGRSPNVCPTHLFLFRFYDALVCALSQSCHHTQTSCLLPSSGNLAHPLNNERLQLFPGREGLVTFLQSATFLQKLFKKEYFFKKKTNKQKKPTTSKQSSRLGRMGTIQKERGCVLTTCQSLLFLSHVLIAHPLFNRPILYIKKLNFKRPN